MSFLAKLLVDGQMHNVLHCVYNFDQSVDHTGKPSGRPQGGSITVTIESPEKLDLFYWMKEPDQTKDGSIKFFKVDAKARFRELFFAKAFCVNLEEEFYADNNIPMQIRLVISAEVISFSGDLKFENFWGNQ